MTYSAIPSIPVFEYLDRITVETRQKWVSRRALRAGEHHGKMSSWINAEIRVWMECARCGRTDRPSVPIRIPDEISFEALEKVGMTCERCQGHATIYLQRALARRH
jgi:hypothetical protein